MPRYDRQGWRCCLLPGKDAGLTAWAVASKDRRSSGPLLLDLDRPGMEPGRCRSTPRIRHGWRSCGHALECWTGPSTLGPVQHTGLPPGMAAPGAPGRDRGVPHGCSGRIPARRDGTCEQLRT